MVIQTYQYYFNTENKADKPGGLAITKNGDMIGWAVCPAKYAGDCIFRDLEPLRYCRENVKKYLGIKENCWMLAKKRRIVWNNLNIEVPKGISGDEVKAIFKRAGLYGEIDVSSNNTKNEKQSKDITKELQDLKKLLDQGVITNKEFDAAKEILQLEIHRAEARGREPIKSLKVGAMLEVPALVYQMTALLERSDFISVGSNDLFQFLFASDRSNPRIADRYDSLSMTGINFLSHIVEQCKLSDTPFSICGEIAGHPLDAMALIGIGFRNLSMQASSIGPVKAMIRSLSVNKLEQYLRSLQSHQPHNVREKLREFAIDHNVII